MRVTYLIKYWVNTPSRHTAVQTITIWTLLMTLHHRAHHPTAPAWQLHKLFFSVNFWAWSVYLVCLMKTYKKYLNSPCSSSPPPCPIECAFPSVPRAELISTPSGSHSPHSISPLKSRSFIFVSQYCSQCLEPRIKPVLTASKNWGSMKESCFVTLLWNTTLSCFRIHSGLKCNWRNFHPTQCFPKCGTPRGVPLPPPLPREEKFKGVFSGQITLRNAAYCAFLPKNWVFMSFIKAQGKPSSLEILEAGFIWCHTI